MTRRMLSLGLLLLAFSKPGPASQAVDAANQSSARRFSFIVGANRGGRDRAVLRYAVDDARAVRKVLEEMGGISPGECVFLEDPTAASFLAEMRALGETVDRARREYRRVEVIFYYSGHSDEENIFLGEERISYLEFRDLITSMKADVRIAILDSCASGAFTLPKGVVKKPPFLLDTAYDMKGYAFMTSSAASEAAQESGRIKRSFFTHNLISGMRGAADMNQDGRITLNEAYQFAFDGTLTQTEKTMAGPQHPSRQIQMSGTGDVIITEIGKSEAVLTIPRDVPGRIFIHDRDQRLVVELNKAAGREVSIGLEAGPYRIIRIAAGLIEETKITLADGMTAVAERAAFQKTDKVPTAVRGGLDSVPLEPEVRRGLRRWQVEVFGGLAGANPGDLNMRADFDDMSSSYYLDDYYQYQKNQGQIASFSRLNEGGRAGYLRYAVPLGIRFRYRLFGGFDLSLGVTRFAGSRSSRYKNTWDVAYSDGSRSTYTEDTRDYRLSASGVVPSLGLHFGKSFGRNLRGEAYFSGGPLLAECSYTLNYSSLGTYPHSARNRENAEPGILDENGKGTGFALQTGLRLDLRLRDRTGIFVEGGYALQKVEKIAGSGKREQAGQRDSWEGDWGIKQDYINQPWGQARFRWPSNAWVIFGGTWWHLRDFKLDLSGLQLKTGVYFRF